MNSSFQEPDEGRGMDCFENIQSGHETVPGPDEKTELSMNTDGNPAETARLESENPGITFSGIDSPAEIPVSEDSPDPGVPATGTFGNPEEYTRTAAGFREYSERITAEDGESGYPDDSAEENSDPENSGITDSPKIMEETVLPGDSEADIPENEDITDAGAVHADQPETTVPEPAVQKHEDGDNPGVNGGPAVTAPTETGKPVRKPFYDLKEEDRLYTEEAKDSTQYETYEYARVPLGNEELRIYEASRIGLSHIAKKKPCQDKVLYREVPGYGAVIVNADGISACELGHFGAQLICETAADEVVSLSEQFSDEKEFIAALCEDGFYTGIRREWTRRIAQYWVNEGNLRPSEDNELYRRFGTTLMIAVITQNWYVTLNIGDGQILLFNSWECMRARLADKEGAAPASIIYDTYLQDLQKGVWPRKYYSGIMLTTDGLYDALDKLGWQAPGQYVNTAAGRFDERQEPVQPFVYSGVINGENRNVDLSRQRSAYDDCSIVMALNESADPTPGIYHEGIRKHLGEDIGIMLIRRMEEAVSYMVYSAASGYQVVLITPVANRLRRDTRLRDTRTDTIREWEPDSGKCWVSDGMCFTVYPMPENAMFLEEAAQSFIFKPTEQYHRSEEHYDPNTRMPMKIVDPLADEKIARARMALESLTRHLACQGMKLSQGAASWILLQNPEYPKLLVPTEAITEADSAAEEQIWVQKPEGFFSGIIGYLECEGRVMPVFRPGYTEAYYRMDREWDADPKKKFFQVVYNEAKQMYGLRNTGSEDWHYISKTYDGTVSTGRVAVFADGIVIKVCDDKGIQHTYTGYRFE